MDIRQIRAFLAIADTGSVTRAAELLHVVQPAVSRQLKLLEDDVGAPLFERDRRGMQLTDAGHVLMERARRALRELDAARLEIRPIPGLISGNVSLGLLPSSCDLLAGPLIGVLQQQYPQIRVSLSVGYTDHLSRWLESGEIDAALLYDPSPSPALNVEPLVGEALSLVGPASLGLADDHPISLQALGMAPLILPSAPHRLRSLVEHACAVAGVQVAIAAETNALSVQKALVTQGFGLSVMPRVAVQGEIERGLFSAARIDSPAFHRSIELALPITRRTPAAVRCVTSALRTCVREIASGGNWLGASWIGDAAAAGHEAIPAE
ncbi:LysR family transcriptional regulator [Cupriavidus sp. SHE]|jgi:LysR family transcriptional regulator, nitrogen assimilation regulatory protein|uniref:LysR family transcriptional regulator n=1 Tax=Cupriavidus metallidurans TaxID=119219 RepID=A0A482IWI3_9BURK|nr:MULTISPECIES: LysR family transcriptional regulator [Cupriavidus]KWR76294.1 LysR family transcriptional regulator [Cupriavidus sp. SHE]QBP11817.1 LysR family transcriptional regulator [Cupriavidus metallidurans]